MSQGSNGSDESLPLSEETFSELKQMNGLDAKNVIDQIGYHDGEIDHHQDYHCFDPQPSCSYMPDSADVFQNSGDSSAGFYQEANGRHLTHTAHADTVSRPQQILPKPAELLSPPALLAPLEMPTVPLDQDRPGPLQFDIDFEPQKEPAPKASPWIFSPVLGKLFAKRKVDIPVRITLNKVPPNPEIFQHLSIRIGMAFTGVEHLRNIVQRCPNHASHSESSGQHIMEISRSDAVFGYYQTTGQHVLTIPFNELEPGRNYKLEFIRFMCQNTCPGGPDRRPFHTVFTLLYKDQVWGVKTLKTKISSTPGRTRDNEEKVVGVLRRVPSSMHKKKVKAKVTETPVQTSSSCQSTMSAVNQAHPGTVVEDGNPMRIKQEEEDNELFTIQVRGRETYEYLMKVKEAFELMRMVPAEVLQRYRESCPPCGPNWFLLQSNQRSTTSQPMSPNVATTSTTTTNQNSTTVSSDARYTLKNILMRKKQGNGLKSMQELKSEATQ